MAPAEVDTADVCDPYVAQGSQSHWLAIPNEGQRVLCMINILPSLLPNLVSHMSEAMVQGEGQKIARLRDFRPVGCHVPRLPFALALHGKS